MRHPTDEPRSPGESARRFLSRIDLRQCDLRPLLIFEVAYFVAYKYGMALGSSHSGAPFWFPDSVLLCALLLSRRQMWWAYIVAPLPLRLFLSPGTPMWFLLLAFANDALKGLVAAYLIRRSLHGREIKFQTLRDLWIYFMTAVLLAPALSGVVGAAAWLALGGEFWSLWRQWFLGDAIANLVFTPLLLYVVQDWRKLAAAKSARYVEAMILFSALPLAAYLVYREGIDNTGLIDPIGYIPVPFLVWAAVRFGPAGASGALSIMSILSVAAASANQFGLPELGLMDSTLSIQLFMVVLAIPILSLSVLVDQQRRTEDSLRDSEERFRLAMNNVAAGVYTLDLQGMVTYVNPAAEMIFGWTNAELLGKKMHDVTHYKHLDGTPYPASECPGLEILEKGIELREYEDVFVRKDGSFLPVVFSASPMIKNGRRVGIVVGFRDDTLRREAERAVRESEERFRVVANAAPAMIWMSHVDKRCTYVNQGWLDFTGRSLDEEIGDGWAEGIHPDDLARVLETYTNAFDRREVFQTEYRFRRHDGEYRWIFDTGVPRFNPDGVFVGYIGSCVDVTERKRIDEALRESEERFRRVFEEGPLGLALVGKDYHFLEVNSAFCQMVGYSEELLLQISFPDITHPDDLRADVELTQRLFRGEIPSFKLRKRYVRKNGEIIWIDLTKSLVRNQDGDPICALAMAENITEVKRAQEIESRLAADLAASRDEIRALAASLMRAQEEERRRVSRDLHDQILQQLASLAIDIGGLAADPPSRESAPSLLKVLQGRIVKASEEARHIAYELHPSMLDDLGLATALRALCHELSAQHLDTELQFSDGATSISVPREVASCVYRIAQEGLQNIAKHSKAKHVSVALAAGQGVVSLTISDDGVGFDLEVVKGRGGLGLIGMEERVRLLNGKVTITARQGHGTQITLAIPVVEPMKRSCVMG